MQRKSILFRQLGMYGFVCTQHKEVQKNRRTEYVWYLIWILTTLQSFDFKFLNFWWNYKLENKYLVEYRGPIYRVSRQLVLNFDFNSWFFWLSYQKIWFAKKNQMVNLNFDTLIFTKFKKLSNFFTCQKKLPKEKENKNPVLPPPWGTHKNRVHGILIFSSNPCTPVHEIWI